MNKWNKNNKKLFKNKYKQKNIIFLKRRIGKKRKDIKKEKKTNFKNFNFKKLIFKIKKICTIK